MGGGVGVPFTCMHMQAHSHAFMKNLHVQKLQMAAPFRHPCLSCLTCVCVCTSMHVCLYMHVHGGFPYPLIPPLTHLQISKNLLSLKQIKIIQFCLIYDL